MKHNRFEIFVFLLGTLLVLILFILGSFLQQAEISARIGQANVFYDGNYYVGAIIEASKLNDFRGEYGSFHLIDAAEKPLEEARNLPSSEFIVAGLQSSRNDDIFDEVNNATIERVLTNFEFERVKYLAIDNPMDIKTALYYFDSIGARHIDKIGDYYFFTKGESGFHSSTTITAFGDVMLGRYVRTLMDANGMDYPFRNLNGSLKGADFVHANFEGPIKEVFISTGKGIEFKFKPDVIWPLKNSGINIVSIANNHALDQGWIGRDDTKKYLNEAGIRYFGNPKDDLNDNAYITEVGGKRFAFVGFDDVVYKIDGDKARELIAKLDEEVDYVIVSVHWGVEYVHTPTQRKINFAHDWIDNGADLIIGHHPHVVQTMEVYKGVPIFYSLGNFVFDQYWSFDTQEGMGFGAIIEDDKIILNLYPYGLPKSQPEFYVGEARTKFLEKFVDWGNYDDELAEQLRNGRVEVFR